MGVGKKERTLRGGGEGEPDGWLFDHAQPRSAGREKSNDFTVCHWNFYEF